MKSRGNVVELIDLPQDLDGKKLKDIAKKVLTALGSETAEISVAFLDEDEMQELNSNFRGKAYPTDVLSFPLDDDFDENNTYRGDIAICPAVAEDQAEEYGNSFEEEVIHLMIHGIIHLHGYDHENDNGEMEELEKRIKKDIFADY